MYDFKASRHNSIADRIESFGQAQQSVTHPWIQMGGQFLQGVPVYALFYYVQMWNIWETLS